MTTRLPIITLDEPLASAVLRHDRQKRRIKTLITADHSRLGRVVIRASERTDRLGEIGVWPFHGLGALDASEHAGCLLGVVTVAHCELAGPGYACGVDALDAALDDFRPGRWVWVTCEPRVFPRPLAWPSSRGALATLPQEWIDAAQPLYGGRGRNRDLVSRVFGVGLEPMVEAIEGRAT